MEKNLPSIYPNKPNKTIKNNEEVYYTKSNQKEEKKEKIDIMSKINKIFNSPNYVYKADVIIKINNEEKTYKIIGKNKNHIITYDNKLIPIDKIEDIKKEE